MLLHRISWLALAWMIAVTASAEEAEPGVVSDRLQRMASAAQNPFVLQAYDQNYFIYSLINDINQQPYAQAQGREYSAALDEHEAKFQISFAIPLWTRIAGSDTSLMASYTQLSLWQLANSELSAPFRETNYEPQLFAAWHSNLEFLGWRWVRTQAGFNHQSNGRSEPSSRSWNRLFADIAIERGNFALQFKPWYRLEEDSKDDDNPDLEDYVGHYQLRLAYKWGEQVYSARGRYNHDSSKGGLEAGWSYPLGEQVRFYFQLYSGYGETLIDYNHSQTRVGLGIMLNDLI